MFSEEIVNDVVKDYLLNTLNNIYIKYPKIFNKSEKEKWEKNIKLNIIDLNDEKKDKFKLKINKKKIIKKLHNTGITIPRNELSDDIRCSARIWGNGSCVNKNGKIIYGKRCNNKKKDNAKYCGIHLKNNPHGDFDKPLDLRNQINYKIHSKCYKKEAEK